MSTSGNTAIELNNIPADFEIEPSSTLHYLIEDPDRLLILGNSLFSVMK